AVPGARDAGGDGCAAVDAPAPRRGGGGGGAGRALGGAAADVLAVEHGGAARGAGGAGRPALEHARGGEAGGRGGRRRGGDRCHRARSAAARPRVVQIGRHGDERTLRADEGRAAPVRRPPAVRLGGGLVSPAVPPPREGVGAEGDVRV